MPTIKQKKAFKAVVGNGGNVSKAMRDTGYTEATLHTPQKLTTSKGWQELMDEHFPEDFLAKKHRQMLKKVERDGQPHTDVKGSLDMAYKLRGSYAPEKKEIDLKNYEWGNYTDIPPEALDKALTRIEEEMEGSGSS